MEKILQYLSELMFHNNREWFHATKAERTEATKEFEDLLQTLIDRIGKFDTSIKDQIPKELTFKMVRDTRFSHDKSPYNPSMRAHIAARGKLPIPVGYFIMVQPGGKSFLGGGLFADMFQDATKMLRDYISVHGAELNEITTSEAFQKYFKVQGTALKSVPKDYDADSPYAEWLKYKCLYLEYSLSDEELLNPNFIERATEIFLAMKPFNDFLNRALEGFEMPARP